MALVKASRKARAHNSRDHDEAKPIMLGFLDFNALGVPQHFPFVEQ